MESKVNSEKIWKIQKKIVKNRKNMGEMIWKIWKKSKLKSEKIWEIWKKGKLYSEMIWNIWKIYVLVIITPKETSSSSSSANRGQGSLRSQASSNGARIRTKNKCLCEGLFLTANSNTINEEDRLTSPSLLMTSLRGLKVPQIDR